MRKIVTAAWDATQRQHKCASRMERRYRDVARDVAWTWRYYGQGSAIAQFNRRVRRFRDVEAAAAGIWKILDPWIADYQANRRRFESYGWFA